MQLPSRQPSRGALTKGEMMDERKDDAGAAAIDFEQAEYTEAPGMPDCGGCGKPLQAAYYSVNGAATCAGCLQEVQAAQQGSFFKALGLGLVAGAVGALIYYGIREISGYDLALITIGLGIVVGIAVRKGAGAKQSVMYRLMAVALAWTAMCATYVPQLAREFDAPDIAEDASEVEVEAALAEAANQGVSSAAYLTATVLAMGVPFFLIANMELLAILIFGFGLWEAWRLSAPQPFVVEGPFEPAQAQPPPQPA